MELLRPLLPPNPWLKIMKVNCGRLDDSAIQILLQPSLRELCMLNCADFSGKLLSEIGGRCKDLRLVYLFGSTNCYDLWLWKVKGEEFFVVIGFGYVIIPIQVSLLGVSGWKKRASYSYFWFGGVTQWLHSFRSKDRLNDDDKKLFNNRGLSKTWQSC